MTIVVARSYDETLSPEQLAWRGQLDHALDSLGPIALFQLRDKSQPIEKRLHAVGNVVLLAGERGLFESAEVAHNDRLTLSFGDALRFILGRTMTEAGAEVKAANYFAWHVLTPDMIGAFHSLDHIPDGAPELRQPRRGDVMLDVGVLAYEAVGLGRH